MGLGVCLATGFTDEGREGRYQIESGKILVYSPTSGRDINKEYLIKIDTKTGKVYKHIEVKGDQGSSDRWVDITGSAVKKK
tara:strand:+ start:110 stop:352 length:243 start_codon:yes stop_codon:yes gene_type:complete